LPIAVRLVRLERLRHFGEQVGAVDVAETFALPSAAHWASASITAFRQYSPKFG
jgi:hypothetical protein